MNAYTRKKDPESVRRNLLDCATQLAAEHGLSGVTIQAVADAAGVTKGGLFHHFHSKKALLEGMFADLHERLDQEIDEAIAKDPEPWGSFTRAYIDSVFIGQEMGFGSPWAALSVAMVSDPQLRQIWANWTRTRQERHKDTDSAPMQEIARLTADGAWLNVTIQEGCEHKTDFQQLRKHLHALSRQKT